MFDKKKVHFPSLPVIIPYSDSNIEAFYDSTGRRVGRGGKASSARDPYARSRESQRAHARVSMPSPKAGTKNEGWPGAITQPRLRYGAPSGRCVSIVLPQEGKRRMVVLSS